MAQANLAALMADAWDEARALAAYGDAPLTVGWYRGLAYVRLWDFRDGIERWRRLPSRDGRGPTVAPTWNPFESSALYEAFR